MSFIAAAIIGGAGLVAGIGGALITSSAASKASQAQQQLGYSALNQQQQMFGTAKNALNPFISSGQGALSGLEALTNPGTSASALAKMPGFQFQLQYGDMGATNALAARGLGASAGPVAAALSNYNQGLAGTYYMNSINALLARAGLGVNAGSALAGNATQTGANMGSTLTGIGNAQASGILGSANALAGGLTGGANSITNGLLLGQMYGGGGGGGMYGAPPTMGYNAGIPLQSPYSQYPIYG